MAGSKTPRARDDEVGGNGNPMRTLRALAVVERVAAATRPVTVPQLALWLDVPKASMGRLVARLVAERYLVGLPGEFTYVPGPRLLHLALGSLGNLSFRREVRGILRGLADQLGETCNLTALYGDEVILLERVESEQPLRMHLEVGTLAPLHCTAGGKLFLARLPRPQRMATLDAIELRRMTPQTLIDRRALESELERLAKLDLGIENQEYIQGMIGIAVPIWLVGECDQAAARTDPRSAPTVAVVCHAAAARIELAELVAKAPMLRNVARQLSRCLLEFLI